MDQGLESTRVIDTISRLKKRIDERFPRSPLGQTCSELFEIAGKAHERSEWVAKPLTEFRYAIGGICFAIVAVTVTLFFMHPPVKEDFGFTDFVTLLEAGMNVIVLVGIAIFFLVSLERRIKRTRALQAVHELRALAHVIDMHQLSKDPDRILGNAVKTASEPERLSGPDVGRYLDFCSEMLSLVGKVAALYVRNFDDPVALAAVSEVETLTTGLSRKIWQKLMILHSNPSPSS